MSSKVTPLRARPREVTMDPRIPVAAASIYSAVTGQSGPVWRSLDTTTRREYLDMALNIQAALYIADNSQAVASQVLADYLPGPRSKDMAAAWWLRRIKAYTAVVRSA